MFMFTTIYLINQIRDTAISIGDEPFTEEEISETIRAHKQIIATMKHQNWPMYRKLKVNLIVEC